MAWATWNDLGKHGVRNFIKPDLRRMSWPHQPTGSPPEGFLKIERTAFVHTKALRESALMLLVLQGGYLTTAPTCQESKAKVSVSDLLSCASRICWTVDVTIGVRYPG
jgi:hypothetical protein